MKTDEESPFFIRSTVFVPFSRDAKCTHDLSIVQNTSLARENEPGQNEKEAEQTHVDTSDSALLQQSEKDEVESK